MDMPSYAALAIEKLNTAGYDAYVVGGCVRDSLLGLTPGDWDMCTGALPEETRACFESEYKVIDTGLKHGTVTVIIDGHPIEITTYRKDGAYTDFRRPDEVRFVSSVREDLSRRDFTVNAMAYNNKNGILDYFGGRADLDARLIRCVGNPEARFGEDALRILRALRFAAVLDFEIEGETAAAAHKMRGLLQNIAVERVYTELKKLVSGAAAAKTIEEFADIVAVAAGQTPKAGDIPVSRDTAVAFCLFFHDGEAVLKRLRAPKAVQASAAAIQKSPAPMTLPDALRLLGRLDKPDFLRLREYYALLNRDTALIDEALTCCRPCKASQLAVTGDDLLLAGVKKGPGIGKAMEKLLTMAMTGEVENKKAALLAALSQVAP